jgi:hypothetical protein
VVVLAPITITGVGSTSATATVIVWGVASATGLGVTTGAVIQTVTATVTGTGAPTAVGTLVVAYQRGRAGAYAPATTGATQNYTTPRTGHHEPARELAGAVAGAVTATAWDVPSTAKGIDP